MKQNENEKVPEGYYAFRPDRLKKLADHLNKGEIYFHDQENIKGIRISEQQYYDWEIEIIAYPIYELIYLFPEEWDFDENIYPRLVGDDHPVTSILKFFGISMYMFRHLFVPHYQELKSFGGRRLEPNATPKDIAYNIYELINISRAQAISGMHPLNLN